MRLPRPVAALLILLLLAAGCSGVAKSVGKALGKIFARVTVSLYFEVISCASSSDDDGPRSAPVRSAPPSRPDLVADMQGWTSTVFGERIASREETAAPAPDYGAASAVPLADRRPFTYLLDGLPGVGALGEWDAGKRRRETGDWTVRYMKWRDARTDLQVRAEVTAWICAPGTEWVVWIENRGKQDSPVIGDLQAMDLELPALDPSAPVVVHHAAGDFGDGRSFLPAETPLSPGDTLRLAAIGGRSSQGALPFFNVQSGGGGLLVAVGWTGQWAARVERTPRGTVRVVAGMERTRLKLHPGERIRTPRVLVMPWRGDRMEAQNRFRRMLFEHYTPQNRRRPFRPVTALQCFDRYFRKRPDWAAEATQLAAAETGAKFGFDTHWMDAAWFPKGFPDGVGTWEPDPAGFPNGLRPLADACAKQGMRLLLWYEPERVAAGSKIAREHPEFVHGGEKGGLFRLDDPAARAWLTDTLIVSLDANGVGVYRQDFNMDPLPFWRAADGPDREGMTEIQHVIGLYELWDALRKRYPSLLIDNCASGGRRIDLETCMRSIPLWRSDTGCSPGHADGNQAQTAGLSPWIPLHSACAWTPDAYEMRSAATAGVICQWDILDPAFPADAARAALAEAFADRDLWSGDFYPLPPVTTASDQWLAWQLHRSDPDEGAVHAFRRKDAAAPEMTFALRGVWPDRTYTVDVFDEARASTTFTTSGRQLMSGLKLKADPGASVRVRYRWAVMR